MKYRDGERERSCTGGHGVMVQSRVKISTTFCSVILYTSGGFFSFLHHGATCLDDISTPYHLHLCLTTTTTTTTTTTATTTTNDTNSKTIA